MFLFITVQIFLYNCLIWILLVLIWWHQCSAGVRDDSSSGGGGGGGCFLGGSSLALASPGGPGGGVCGGRSWLTALLSSCWTVHCCLRVGRALLWSGWEKGRGLMWSVEATQNESKWKGGGHRTHLASSIAAASSRGPFRASQVAFAFSSKCFRLKEKKKITVKNNKKA